MSTSQERSEQYYISCVDEAKRLVAVLKEARAEGRPSLIDKGHQMHNSLANAYKYLKQVNKDKHREEFAMLTVQLALGSNPAYFLIEGILQLQDDHEALRAQLASQR